MPAHAHPHDHTHCEHARRPPATALALAVGNTNTAVRALAEDWIDSPCGPLPTNELARRPAAAWRWIEHVAQVQKETEVVLGGVVPKALDALEKLLRKRGGPRVWRFRRNLPCPLKIAPKPARAVGDDRLLAALATLSFGDSHPWVIVDCGTAITVNAFRPAKRGNLGTFEGGLIFPGERLALEALARGTAQLPELAPWPEDTRRKPPALGKNTAEAIRAGVRRMVQHAIAAVARDQAKLLGRGTRILLTGGGIEPLAKDLQKELKAYKPHLYHEAVPDGLLTAWACHRQWKPPS
ncbi:MAG: type III pantothenate kinase [Planctomycetota bacterium]|nr:type III pantothenate kinase [Planctomycetota bacterium]